MRKFFYLLAALLFVIRVQAQDPFFIKDIKKAGEVNCVSFSPDGKKIIAGYADGSARIIDPESEKVEVTIKDHWKGVMAVEMDPKGKYFMTAGDNTIKIWSPEGELIYNLKSHTTTICSADINPAGDCMVSGAINRVFKEWDVLGGELKRNFDGHTDVTMAVKFSRDGNYIASGSGDHNIKVWDSESGKELMVLPGQQEDIYSLDFSADGNFLASASKDKTIRIFDLKEQELFKVLKGHKNFVMDIEFSPDNLHLISCSFDKEVKVWEISTGKCIYSFIDHEGEVTDVCFSPDGKTFASASQDKTIKLWRFSKEMFVDFYYSPRVIEEMNANELFLPRQKGENKEDFEAREQKAARIREEIYNRYYLIYLEDLKNGSLPGS